MCTLVNIYFELLQWASATIRVAFGHSFLSLPEVNWMLRNEIEISTPLKTSEFEILYYLISGIYLLGQYKAGPE